MFSKIWSFFKTLDPIKLALDYFTVIILISLIIEFFYRQPIMAVSWMADLYRITLTACAGYLEMNRWVASSQKEKKSLVWLKHRKLIQGEYYVWAWAFVAVSLLFFEVILPDYFYAKPEHLLSLTEWVFGIFLATYGSKKFEQFRTENKNNPPSLPPGQTPA